MKKRLKKKYLPLKQAILEDNSTDITVKGVRKLIKMFGNKNRKTLFRWHEDDLKAKDPFALHEPGQKYHAEDCNMNNPNNFIYHRKRPAYLKTKNKKAKCFYYSKRE